VTEIQSFKFKIADILEKFGLGPQPGSRLSDFRKDAKYLKLKTVECENFPTLTIPDGKRSPS